MNAAATKPPSDFSSESARRSRDDDLRVQRERQRRIRIVAQDHYDRTRIEDRIKPTAETERKLRPSPITRLYDSGSITGYQRDAALEIAQIFEAIAGGMMSKAATAERTGRGKGDIGAKVAQLHIDHYLPWAYYLGGSPELPPIDTPHGRHPGRPATRGRCAAALELTIDILIDGRGLEECDRDRKWRNGRARETLRYALAVYADRAGWENNGAMIAAFEYARAMPAISHAQNTD